MNWNNNSPKGTKRSRRSEQRKESQPANKSGSLPKSVACTRMECGFCNRSDNKCLKEKGCARCRNTPKFRRQLLFNGAFFASFAHHYLPCSLKTRTSYASHPEARRADMDEGISSV